MMHFLLLACFLFAGVRASPNIILLFTDDQDITLGGATPMSFTRSLMEDGVKLTNFFVNTPVCCPSRTTMLSGNYPHNWLGKENKGCMHMNVTGPDFMKAMFSHDMKELGYTTGMFGKLLNGGGMTPYCNKKDNVPLPGFDSYGAMCNTGKYYKNTFTNNGTIYTSGTKPTDYLTSIIGNHSHQFVEASLQAGRPFFVYIAPHAPHVPATPAPWYADKFSDKQAPRTPNYNYSATDHHYVIRQQQPMTDKEGADSDDLFRNRWRSLLSVDDITRDLVDLLKKYDQMDNTVFAWTSDHGFQLGQFRLPSCKLQPYDHDIRVPFSIRGPGITKGEYSFVAGIVDVAPSLVELAGGSVPEDMDGHSFAKLVSGQLPRPAVAKQQRDKHMIEYWSLGNVVRYGHYIDMPNNTYIGVRLINDTHNFLYAEFYSSPLEQVFTDSALECELFDVTADPYQMTNLCGTEKADKQLVQELHEYIHTQVKCRGQSSCTL